ncbi:hypothetical protein K1719_032229 [Acacia pycnantha]|nr:hypothetical protein K1719_032229 [Acacia pycnantha]
MDDFKGTEVIGVSNGLICLASNMPFKFILWNPTIRKYAWLSLKMDWEDLRLSIVGFGFDCSSNNFKIINIISCPSIYNWTEEIDSVWVFSYTTWSWKRLIDVSILHSCSIYRGKPNVYFNGIIYWIAHNNEINCGVILTFDLSREIFGQKLLPEDAHRHFPLNSVATTGDLLLFTQLSLLDNEYDNGFSGFAV